jgi:hypothetical protein
MTTITAAPYNLGFTAASLRPELSRIIAEQYLAAGDWTAAKVRVISSNALQSRNALSSVRLERELRQRLQRLTDDQLRLLAEAPAEDRAAIAWLAAVKHIEFAFDFAAEVMRDKLASHDPVLRPSDYEDFVEAKSALHPELAQLKETSRKKIRQVLLRMLAEAGLLRAGAALGEIQRPVLSPAVTRVIQADSPRWFAAFLVPDAEIRA